MIANDAFFTWLGMITHISFWRQLIWIIGLFIVYKILTVANNKLPYIKSIYRNYKKIFIVVTIFSVITLILNGFSLLRIVYAIWNYSFGLPFLLFPYVCKQCDWDNRKFNNLFIILGTFLSIGILTDFLSGGLITSMFLIAVTQEDAAFEAGRYCFLSTAPTIFAVYYCFCLFCCLNEFSRTDSFLKKYLLFFLSVLFIFGSIFCGSRQTLIALILVECLGFWSLFKTNKSVVVMAFLVACTSYLFLPIASSMLSDNQGFQERYNSEAFQEDDRTSTWMKGVNHCILSPNIRTVLIGDGVGYTQGKGADSPKDVGSHFENTFLARISDVGWFLALWMLLLPVYYIVKYRRFKLTVNNLYISLVLAYLFICMISPNGAAETTQMSLFIILGKFLEDNGYEHYERT